MPSKLFSNGHDPPPRLYALHDELSPCRFAAEGYRLPKPMINIVGRPMLFWLLDNLKFEPDDTLWVGIQQELEAEYAMEARLRKEYPALDLRVVLINFQTRGAAETMFIMLQVCTADGEEHAVRTFSRLTLRS